MIYGLLSVPGSKEEQGPAEKPDPLQSKHPSAAAARVAGRFGQKKGSSAPGLGVGQQARRRNPKWGGGKGFRSPLRKQPRLPARKALRTPRTRGHLRGPAHLAVLCGAPSRTTQPRLPFTPCCLPARPAQGCPDPIPAARRGHRAARLPPSGPRGATRSPPPPPGPPLPLPLPSPCLGFPAGISDTAEHGRNAPSTTPNPHLYSVCKHRPTKRSDPEPPPNHSRPSAPSTPSWKRGCCLLLLLLLLHPAAAGEGTRWALQSQQGCAHSRGPGQQKGTGRGPPSRTPSEGMGRRDHLPWMWERRPRSAGSSPRPPPPEGTTVN